MINFRADLHNHSTCSDGSNTPEEVVDLAVQSQLLGLSITDHDTIEAYPDILTYAVEKNIKMVPGVEFSASHQDTSIHVLGYSFSLENLDLKYFCLRHLERRKKRYKAILKKFQNINIDITEEELLKFHPDGKIGRPHFAKILMRKGYVSSMREAFNKYLIKGTPCFVPGEAFPVTETVEMIHKANGLAVLAHPHLIKNSRVIKSLLKLNFDGIECYYANFEKHRCQKFLDITQERNLLLTAGSDYHGSGKPENILGSSWVDFNNFGKLYEHFLRNSQ